MQTFPVFMVCLIIWFTQMPVDGIMNDVIEKESEKAYVSERERKRDK